MASKVGKLMENPSLEEILAFKQIELIDLASHLGVSIRKYFKKQQILNEIIVNLSDNKMLEEEAMEYVSKEEVSEAIKIKQMSIAKRDRTGKLAIERERLEIEREERQRDREAQPYIKKKQTNKQKQTNKKKKKQFNVTEHFRFIPPFNENEVDEYFLFEKAVKDLNWTLNKYTILLKSVLICKTSEVYLSLKPEQMSD